MKFKQARYTLVGIDPGITGAVAAIDDLGDFICVHDAPTLVVKKGKGKRTVYQEAEMAKIFAGLMSCYDVRIVGLENVHSMPGQGTTGVFSLGTGFGLWLGILAALKLPYERIEPAKWKRVMGVTADKAGSIVLAQRLFPTAPLTLVKHHGRGEAILLAEYLRRRLVREPDGGFDT